MVRHLTTVLFFFVLLPFESSAKQLDTAQLKTFSEFVIKETQESPVKLIPHLSNDIEVETVFGSNAEGFTLFFNKIQYVELMSKLAKQLKDGKRDQDIDIFGFKVTPANNGEFRVIRYSEAIKRTVWSIYTVKLVNNKILITKIIDLA